MKNVGEFVSLGNGTFLPLVKKLYQGSSVYKGAVKALEFISCISTEHFFLPT